MEPLKSLPGMKPMEPLKPMEPMRPMEPLRPLPFLNPGTAGERPWWPETLGTPSAAGGQNDVRYAYFPASRRLAVQRGDDILVHDTADHHIHGVGQQQSPGYSSLVFTSQLGTVPLDDLKIVDVLRAES